MKILGVTYQETKDAVKRFESKVKVAKMAEHHFFIRWANKKSQRDAINEAKWYDDFMLMIDNEAFIAFEDIMLAIKVELEIKEFAETASYHNDLP